MAFGLAPATADAGLTIDLRAVSLNGQPLPDGSTPESVFVNDGDQVGFEVVARVSGTNGLDDEGFTGIHGVFRSSTGGLLGDLSTSRVAPFTGSGSQDGSQIDIDSDGDFDIGDRVNGGQPNLYFVGRSNVTERGGVRVGTDAEEFVIGTGTWTSKAGSTGSETFLDFMKRRNPGNPGTNGTSYAQWFEDGSGTSSVRNGASPYTVDGLHIIEVPEPGSAALTTLAALGLLARRRGNRDGG